MNKRNPITAGLLILGMVAAAPLAFAQTTPTQGQEPTSDTAAPPATGAAEQQARQSSASGQGMSWADLDADGNGSLSAQESKRHEGLSSVFAQADADGDGQLTADEYRAYITAQQGGAAQE